MKNLALQENGFLRRMFSRALSLRKALLIALPALFALCVAMSTSVVTTSCTMIPQGDPNLTANTCLELVDWHISGLWVINCPVAWVRVANRNPVAIKDVTFKYITYDFEGKVLDEGTFTIEGVVPAGSMKNFIELYLGLVKLESDKLSVHLVGVNGA